MFQRSRTELLRLAWRRRSSGRDPFGCVQLALDYEIRFGVGEKTRTSTGFLPHSPHPQSGVRRHPMRRDRSNDHKGFRPSGPKRSGPSEGVSHAYRPHRCRLRLDSGRCRLRFVSVRRRTAIEIPIGEVFGTDRGTDWNDGQPGARPSASGGPARPAAQPDRRPSPTGGPARPAAADHDDGSPRMEETVQRPPSMRLGAAVLVRRSQRNPAFRCRSSTDTFQGRIEIPDYGLRIGCMARSQGEQ